MSTFDDVFVNSLFVVDEEHPEIGALLDCADRINSKIEDSNPSQETKLAPVFEEQRNSTDVSDDSDNTIQFGCGIRYTDEYFRIPSRSY
jgi:hypothetical protein